MKVRHQALLLALCGALSMAGTAAMAKDGTYVGTALGRNGDVKVEVQITGDKIASVKILD